MFLFLNKLLLLFQDVIEFLMAGGQVAVYDAANITQERRQLIHHIIVNEMGYKLFFIESICNEPKIIEANIMVSCFYTLTNLNLIICVNLFLTYCL